MTSHIHSLTERAMVCNLSIGLWAGYRLDRDATRQVTEQAGSHADAARVNKHLVPKDALAPIVTTQNAIRAHFYTNTLPWRDNGDRVLTRKLFLTFVPEHERLVGEFEVAVAKFLGEDYPSVIAKAEFRMGAMFDRADYPSASDLRRRFYATLDIDAITTAGDFRVQIDQEHADKVRASMEAAAEARLRAATADVWHRMAAALGKFRERMADPTAVFRDSTITNVAEMLDLVPGLNVLDDPEIEGVRAAIAHALGGIDAKTIRKNPELRAELAGEAGEIMGRLRGFMSAFGAGDK